MPERIPELDRMAAEAKEVDMLPPSEIRRLGNRRRVVRRTTIGVAVAVLALVAGVGLWQSPILEQARNPQWANTAVPESPSPVPSEDPTGAPSETPSPEPTQQPSLGESPGIVQPTTGPTGPGGPGEPAVLPPTWDNVPTAYMLFLVEAPGEVKFEGEGLGQAAHGLCDPGAYGSPTTILTRSFGTEGYPSYVDATVFGYQSAEAATVGFNLLKAAALDCNAAMETRSGLVEPRIYDGTGEVPFDPTTVDAEPVEMAYVTQMGLIPDSDTGMFGDTLLLQAGERLLWVTSAFEGQDNNCALTPDDEHIGQCQLPASIPEALIQLAAN